LYLNNRLTNLKYLEKNNNNKYIDALNSIDNVTAVRDRHGVSCHIPQSILAIQQYHSITNHARNTLLLTDYHYILPHTLNSVGNAMVVRDRHGVSCHVSHSIPVIQQYYSAPNHVHNSLLLPDYNYVLLHGLNHAGNATVVRDRHKVSFHVP
jgi:hypothetical protein